MKRWILPTIVLLFSVSSACALGVLYGQRHPRIRTYSLRGSDIEKKVTPFIEDIRAVENNPTVRAQKLMQGKDFHGLALPDTAVFAVQPRPGIPSEDSDVLAPKFCGKLTVYEKDAVQSPIMEVDFTLGVITEISYTDPTDGWGSVDGFTYSAAFDRVSGRSYVARLALYDYRNQKGALRHSLEFSNDGNVVVDIWRLFMHEEPTYSLRKYEGNKIVASFSMVRDIAPDGTISAHLWDGAQSYELYRGEGHHVHYGAVTPPVP